MHNKKKYIYKAKQERYQKNADKKRIRSNSIKKINNSIYEGCYKRPVISAEALRELLHFRNAHTIKICPHFSLTGNCSETLKILNDVYATLDDDSQIALRIDFSAVTTLSIDALLYLLAQLARSTAQKKKYVRGNRPKDKEANALFEQSGFLKIVASYTTVHKSSELVTIRSSSSLDPKILGDLSRFISERLNKPRGYMAKIQDLLMEIANNSCEHAYIDKNNSCPKWFAFARHNPQTQNLQLIMLDTGRGIPATIKRTLGEKITSFVWTSNDLRLMHAALTNNVSDMIRSHTGERHRGKGLPEIHRFKDDPIVNSMIIVSGKANIDLAQPKKDCLLEESLRGTLYSLELGGNNENDTPSN